MMSKKMIRIICIIMAVLMVLSVGAVVLQVIAIDENAYQTFVNPATGDNGSDYYVPAGIAVAAILAVVLCLVLPKMKKNDSASKRSDSSGYPVEKDDDTANKKSVPKVKTVGRTVNRSKQNKAKSD